MTYSLFGTTGKTKTSTRAKNRIRPETTRFQPLLHEQERLFCCVLQPNYRKEFLRGYFKIIYPIL